MRNFLAVLIGLTAFTHFANANICGTDYQNFNPTTNGLDFVTVHSSETLNPCIVNTGLFFNYAANSLTYSKTLNANFPSGHKRRDRTTGADLNVGMGITDRWDVGLSVPFILNQSIQSDSFVSSFDQNGATEVKANTKYKLWGNQNQGLAAVFSVNHNLIVDNPFSGTNPGPTFNFELAADTTIANKWALGVNLGYRDRHPGRAIPNVPFVPMGDQWIYSAAASYLVSSLDTKVIMEIYGASPAKKVALDSDRNMNSLEGLMGIKHDLGKNLAIHFGGGAQIGSSLGGPDWRVYAGLNFAWSPFCTPVYSASSAGPNEPEVLNLNVEALFATNSSVMDDQQFGEVDNVFEKIVKKGFERVVVEGHTDSMGADSYNMDLSRRRAETIRKHLMTRFKIEQAKIEAQGFGSTRPIADNGNYQGRQKNRRVEIKIFPKK